MGNAIAGQGYPPLTRHPDLQRIREAQNQLLIDPDFMQRLLGGFGQQGSGLNTSGQMGQGQQPFQKMQPGENPMDYRVRERQFFLRGGHTGQNPYGALGGMQQQPNLMNRGRPGGKG